MTWDKAISILNDNPQIIEIYAELFFNLFNRLPKSRQFAFMIDLLEWLDVQKVLKDLKK